MEVITVNLVVMVFDQVFIRLTVGSTEANIGTQGSNPCPSGRSAIERVPSTVHELNLREAEKTGSRRKESANLLNREALQNLSRARSL